MWFVSCSWADFVLRVVSHHGSEVMKQTGSLMLLRRTTTRCNTLQHTATHCSTLQHTATHCNTLQHTATHCNTLQHTATHCSTLQHTAAIGFTDSLATHGKTMHHAAAHCNALQRTATHRNAPQRTAAMRFIDSFATHDNTLQHNAIRCDTLRHAATHCNALRRFAYDGFTRVTLGVHTIWGAIRSYYHFSLTLLRRTAAHCNPLQHTADLCAIYRLNSENFQILFRGLLKIFGEFSTLFNSVETKTWFACVCASNSLPTLFREFWPYSESFWLCSILFRDFREFSDSIQRVFERRGVRRLKSWGSIPGGEET